MTVLSILQYPNKKLRNIALPVVDVNVSIRTHVADMFETMYNQNGVGLAATQVDIPLRIVVIDVSEDRKSPLCVINPEIVNREGIQYESEGCLSFPGLFDSVQRAAKIRLRALDEHGTPFELDAEGLLSICIQHELDHLDGILFIDHLSRLKQDRLQKKLEKARRQAVS